jgi:hypothetical protein
MLKLAIAAVVSIAFFSSANTVAALTHKRPNNLSKPNSSTRQSKANVPQSEIKGISQAINQYFKDKNNREISSGQTGGACFFFEVKSLKLVSLADNNAEVLAKVEAQGYKISRSSPNSSQWIYEKTNTSIPAKNEHMIMLKKSNEKWKVSVSVI